MTYASTLILEVSEDLDDQFSGSEYTRWTEDDLLAYLNDAQLVTVIFLPSANTLPLVYQLVAGTRQGMPDGTASFTSPAGATHPKVIEPIKIARNMGTIGLVAGTSVYPIEPKDMDEVSPDWKSATAAATVVHVMFDANIRDKFDVYPPQPTVDMGYVELVASAVPALVEKSGESFDVDINLGDEYIPALKAYMRYRAYAVDAKSSANAYQRALDNWNMYLALIGKKDLTTDELPAAGGLDGNKR